MSEKRRDNRNRILREGEYQRKDGRYRFRYIDEDGKEKNVYIAVFRNKAYIHRSETSLSSQKGKQSEKHVGLHSEEHPVS